MFDAEAAWADLAERVAEREGWGRDKLLAEMAKLQVKHRISETLFERMMRIFRGRVILVPADQAEALPAGESRAAPGAAEEGAAPIEVLGGRDDDRSRREPAAAG